MLGGVDVTGQLQGGQIGANITLRDSTLPTFQGELDEFSQNLASRFSAQGLTLFHRSCGCRSGGRRRAGADRLCRLRGDDPGEPGGAGHPVAGAGRHHCDRRQRDRRQRLHAEPRRRSGRVHHHDPARAGQRAGLDGARRAPPCAACVEHHGPGRKRHLVRALHRAGHARRHRRNHGGRPIAGQRHRHQPARHRTGRADHAVVAAQFRRTA